MLKCYVVIVYTYELVMRAIASLLFPRDVDDDTTRSCVFHNLINILSPMTFNPASRSIARTPFTLSICSFKDLLAKYD